MKQKILWGLGLLFAFLVLLLVTAPAIVVTRTTSQLVPALAFSGVSGSLWQGEAAQLRYGAVSLANVRWQLSPWQLFLGKAALQFEFGSPQTARGNGRIAAGFGGAIASDELYLQLPAQALQPLIALTGVQLGGELQLNLRELALDGRHIERLQGRIVWQRAQVRTPLGQPQLGAYAIDLGGDGEGGVTGDITDIDGVLGLTGRIHLTPQRLELDGSVRSDLPEELDRFFRVIGRPDGDRYQLRWQQQFRG